MPSSLGIRLAPALVLLALAGPASAKDKEPEVKDGPHLRYARSYADAVAEAKERGCVILATIHEDGWKYCAEMHRSVLEDSEFIAWANENVVVVVAHKGSHKSVDVAHPVKGEPKKQCSLYLGMTCDEHSQAFDDLVVLPSKKDDPKNDDKAKKPAPKSKKGEAALPHVEITGYPASFVIAPDGTVSKHGADRAPAACKDGLLDVQRKFEENPIPASQWPAVQKAWADAEKAFAAAKWKPCLEAIAKVETAVSGKLPKAWVEKEKARVDAIDAKARARFSELQKGKDPAAVAKAVRALRDDVGVALAAGPLPVVADLDAFLAAAPP